MSDAAVKLQPEAQEEELTDGFHLLIDALKVNGYDESIKYGGEDKEFGLRLLNAGVRGRHLRYTAPLVHLDHPRGYADPERIRRHKAMIREARQSVRSWTADGIVKGPAT